ncbi:hypothetical protein [Thalassobacillus hwangdonensis]|uniref:Uncharacterized protein n=1 Tax=Thalassobacillus hwangdonensis TaxID=546108 RepID=A0ABW3L3F0_9BACI
MVNFGMFRGMVTQITEFPISADGTGDGCYKLIRLEDGPGGVVEFVAGPGTYFVDQAIVNVGDGVTGYYDRNAPVPLIYPPRYQALVLVKESPGMNVKVDQFDRQLVSSDGMLKLNVAPYTQLRLTNGQPFKGELANRNLIVMYGPSTMSIPAQTTPYKIIVWC